MSVSVLCAEDPPLPLVKLKELILVLAEFQ